MRELKFRALVNETMLYFDNPKTGIQYRCGEIELSIGWDEYKQPKYYDHDEYNPEPTPEFEIMQYTGLKDKNGVEIYESDLVINSSRNGGNPHIIKWSEAFGGWIGNYNGLAYLIAQELHEIEVIGNLHENPELIN